MLHHAMIPNNKKLPGVYVTGCNVVSSNDVIIFNGGFEGNVDTFRISEKAIGLLTSYRVRTVATSHNWIHFDNVEGDLFIRKMYDTDYPYNAIAGYVNSVLEPSPDHIETPLPERFQDVLTAVRDLTEDSDISVTLNNDGIVVDAKNVDGNFTDFIQCAISGPTPLTFSVKPSILLSVMKKGATNLRVIVEAKRLLCVFVEKSFMFIVGLRR
jgi:hypothetical protein